MIQFLISTLKRTYAALPQSYKPEFKKLLGLIFVNSLLDLGSFGVVVPLLPLFLNPHTFSQSKMGVLIFGTLPFTSLTTLAIFLSLLVVFLFFVKNALGFWIQKKLSTFTFNLFQSYSTALQKYYDQKGLLEIQSVGTNVLTHEICNQTAWYAQNLVLPLLTILNETLVLSVILIGITLYAPFPTLLVLCCLLPPFYFFYWATRQRSKTLFEKVNDVTLLMRKVLTDYFFGFKDVKITSTQNTFFKAYQKASQTYSHLLVQNYLLNALPARILELASISGMMFLSIYCLLQLENINERITLLGLFVLATYRTMPSINRISTALLSLKGYEYAFESIQKTLGLTEPSKNLAPVVFNQSIEFKNVFFTYPGQTTSTLDNLNLLIKKNAYVGVLGASGKGKTTFLNILAGLISPSKGELCIDNTPLTNQNIPAWQHHLGLVSQEVYILEGTIAQNVAFGVEDKNIDEKKVLESLDKAQVLDQVLTFDQGIHSQTGERGAFLSIGQKQRIGIARAIYHGAQILILDEVTSALDEQTEQKVLETLKSLHQHGFTLICVSHRPQALKDCSQTITLS